jgi:peptide chain release factor 1
MASRIEDRLEEIEARYEQVEAEMASPAVASDPERLRDLGRAYAELGGVVGPYRELKSVLEQMADARSIASEDGGDEMATYLAEETERLEARAAEIRGRLELLLVPKDPNEGKDVIVEIRGAEGGEEANLFARDLFDMYQAYALRHGWKLEVLSADASDLGGFNQITFVVRGDGAWSHLKYEGGPHRVQRVPVTESQGRIHTSAATVTVLAEADEVDVEIDPNDLQIDVYRSSGPGGQSVNTTDSAVRITHKPTGIVVAMQDERSQLQNRARAMQVLRARLLKAEQDRQAAVMAAERKSQVGGGGRSEKIRTYNYKQNRVTDHRIGLTLNRLQDVLAGDLDEMLDALGADERARQLAGTDA